MKKEIALIVSTLIVSAIFSNCDMAKSTEENLGSDAEMVTSGKISVTNVTTEETTTETNSDRKVTIGEITIETDYVKTTLEPQAVTDLSKVVEWVFEHDEYLESSSDNYKAKADTGISQEDSVAVMQLCHDMIREYCRKSHPQYKAPTQDFSEYMSNANLINYLNYGIQRLPQIINTNWFEFENLTMEFGNDYVYVQTALVYYDFNGENKHKNGVGTVHFIVKNKNGRFEIVDVYFGGYPSVDVSLRGDFSVENNLDFWDNPDKYQPVLDKMEQEQYY